MRGVGVAGEGVTVTVATVRLLHFQPLLRQDLPRFHEIEVEVKLNFLVWVESPQPVVVELP